MIHPVYIHSKREAMLNGEVRGLNDTKVTHILLIMTLTKSTTMRNQLDVH